MTPFSVTAFQTRRGFLGADDMPRKSRELGLKGCGAYYVPAVGGRFFASIDFNGTVIGQS